MLSLNTVALKHLRISPLNVRKTNLDEDIAALAADIQAHGLKQNLVVVADSTANGMFEVVAGGRRLQALWKLADDHVLDIEEQIPVLVEERAEGRATSLSENLHRIAMNPADEFTAFASIVQDHHGEPDPILYCARRFGVSRAHVEQRLRLAALAPDIFDALRAGKISVDAAKAYGAFADHGLQLQVFKAEEKRTYGGKHDPRQIRDALKTKTYPATIAQAVYVGLDAYIEAGGGVERELFLGADEGDRLTSPSLLDKLAREKAQRGLPELVKRDGFANALLTQGFSQYPAWPKTPDGFIRAYGKAYGEIAKKVRKETIGVYSLAADGAGLACVGYFQAQSAVQAANDGGMEKRRAAHREEQRQAEIRLRAARLSVEFTGTPFDGRAYWPGENDYLEELTERDDGVYVAVLIRVDPQDVEAHAGEAEAALVADEQAERAADQSDNDRVTAAEGEAIDA